MVRLTAIVLFLFLQACAFTDATLPVQHNEQANTVGPVSDIDARTFLQPVLEDARDDKERVGWKKNGYGQNTADITTEQPVTTIVENALADAITDNGHAISETGSILIRGSVDRFWFEVDANFWTVEFIADVQCTLNFVDAVTNTTIYTSSYAGSHKKETGGGLEKTWTEVLGQAVDNLIEDIVFDEDLSEALHEYDANKSAVSSQN